MTQPISRRAVAKAGIWSAPVVAASAAVPAYAASKEVTVQHGLFVSAQYGGGFIGYTSSTSTGPVHPTSPDAYFASNYESDLNWDDNASKPTNPDLYVNGEGKFTPVNNS